MLLIIYSFFNLNDVSWGTRENPSEPEKEADKKEDEKSKSKNNLFNKIFQQNTDADGAFDFSFAGLFRCILCTHNKPNPAHAQILQISNQLNDLSNKMSQLEMYVFVFMASLSTEKIFVFLAL